MLGLQGDTTQLLELNEYLDDIFELATTDNRISRQIFREAQNRMQSGVALFG